jgi:eukaryotic-like serine/threonine-protein kinase
MLPDDLLNTKIILFGSSIRKFREKSINAASLDTDILLEYRKTCGPPYNAVEIMTPTEKIAANPSLFLIGNRYQLLKRLGEGGVGKVYAAKDFLSNRVIALKRFKTLRGDRFEQPETVHKEYSLFDHEFRVLSALHHPNIINVLDFGIDTDGRPYFTMKLVEDARTILSAAAECDLDNKVRLLIETLQALDYIHRHGVIHCDLKPSNILVDSDDRVKIVDFGLASGNVLLSPLGTWAYMAPEVLLGQPTSAQSDLYSVGVIAFEMFGGTQEDNGHSLRDVIDNTLHQVPDVTTLPIPNSLKHVIARLLSKAAFERYANAFEATNALLIATGQPCQAHPSLRENITRVEKSIGWDAERERVGEAPDEALQSRSSA